MTVSTVYRKPRAQAREPEQLMYKIWRNQGPSISNWRNAGDSPPIYRLRHYPPLPTLESINNKQNLRRNQEACPRLELYNSAAWIDLFLSMLVVINNVSYIACRSCHPGYIQCRVIGGTEYRFMKPHVRMHCIDVR